MIDTIKFIESNLFIKMRIGVLEGVCPPENFRIYFACTIINDSNIFITFTHKNTLEI